jgi:hypothetical protein
MTQICYKIRSKTDPELFLSGTPSYHAFDKTGRVFITIGKLRTFLTNVLSNEYRRKDINNWEIVEIEMRVKEVKGLLDVIKPEKMMQYIKNM